MGIDSSEEYIAAARRRYGVLGHFERLSIGTDRLDQLGKFDVVMANGVLHHLDDSAVNDMFDAARSVLADGGRVVTLDGCYTSDQSSIARYLLSRDRGRFVRNNKEYERLARVHFRQVISHLRHDLMRVPYTLIILECRL